MQTLFRQGPAVTLRMFVLVIASIALMTVDHRWNHLQFVRTTLSNLLYPLQYSIDLPVRFYYWADETLTTQNTLLRDNRELRARQLENRVQLQKLDILEKENERLRLLLSATPKTREKVLISEIIGVDVDPYRQLFVINKGSMQDITRGQPIIDAHGVVGQVLSVNALSSVAMLITDASHALPVQIDRTGLRAVVFGTGQIDHMDLRHIPHNADVQQGDMLITSGLGGRFPPNYPVAIITSVERVAGEAFARIRAEPLALLDQSREVLLVWTTKEGTATEQAEQAEQKTEADGDTNAQ
jgi:rod shape-determining protein MreC